MGFNIWGMFTFIIPLVLGFVFGAIVITYEILNFIYKMLSKTLKEIKRWKIVRKQEENLFLSE